VGHTQPPVFSAYKRLFPVTPLDPSSSDVKNVCSCTSTPVNVCVVWCLIKQQVANFGVMSPRKLFTPVKGNIYRWVK
jgi:hypothetical protein